MIRKNQQRTGAPSLGPAPERQSAGPARKSPFFSLSQFSERLAVRFALFARLYFDLFYRKMLANEVDLAGLKPGASVLHIGGGAYPYTAIYLARKGYRVRACDCNSSAVEMARDLVQKNGLGDRITIFHRNGCTVDSSNYDAVWLSLNICPKERVLEQSWASLKEGGLLIYRKLPAWLVQFGRCEVDFSGGGEARVEKALTGLGAESLVLKKDSAARRRAKRSRDENCAAEEKIWAVN